MTLESFGETRRRNAGQLAAARLKRAGSRRSPADVVQACPECHNKSIQDKLCPNCSRAVFGR